MLYVLGMSDMLSDRQSLCKYISIAACCLFLSACTAAEVAVNMAKKAHVANINKIEENTKSGADTPATAMSKNSGDLIKNNNISKAVKNDIITPQPRYKIGDPTKLPIMVLSERDLRYDETGIASWYGDEFAGRLTANGEIFDPTLVSAAHKTLPMPSVVRVTNLENGKSLVVRLNDRGPFVAGRIIDLSREAARRLGFLKSGIARVRVQILAEQSLAMERAAKNNNFSKLVLNETMPQVEADNVPEVNLDATTTRQVQSDTAMSISAIELLARSRIGEVIEVPVTQTNIWVQIGAFYNKDSANSVLNRYKSAQGSVSEGLHNGKAIYKARIGPITTVEDADIILSDVLKFGFEGAHIIVD